nr:hypothetical protein CFP56_11527 [Quercus suber]
MPPKDPSRLPQKPSSLFRLSLTHTHSLTPARCASLLQIRFRSHPLGRALGLPVRQPAPHRAAGLQLEPARHPPVPASRLRARGRVPRGVLVRRRVRRRASARHAQARVGGERARGGGREGGAGVGGGREGGGGSTVKGRAGILAFSVSLSSFLLRYGISCDADAGRGQG